MPEVGEVIQTGQRRCETCGEPHDRIQLANGGSSWADATDGHTYIPESWKSIAYRYRDQLGLEWFE